MRQVAGTLRLDLAQYRELAAFAQFASDLDKATQDQLNRGKRLVEVLKQRQYEPRAVEQQILIIYAGVNGFLDNVEVEQVGEYETELSQFVEAREASLFTDLVARGKIDDDLKTRIEAVLQEFTELFIAARKTAAA